MEILSPNPDIGNPALGLRSLAGIRRTKSSLPRNVGFDPECGNWSAENWADRLNPTYDDRLSLKSGCLMSARVMTACDPQRLLIMMADRM